MAELFGDLTLGSGYTSRAQQARRISEDWVSRNCYCLRCDSDRILPTTANTRSTDFRCERCHHAYELKSKRGVFSTSILDGAYGTMLQTIREGRTPTFLLLEYTAAWSVESLRAIHHSLITENAVIARRPLSATAKRAGWVGCSIALPAIAIQGQLHLVNKGMMQERSVPREAFGRLERLSSLPSEGRTWAATVLQMTNRLPSRRFTLTEMYSFESELRLLFPKNQNIGPKIRQQLQFLRDSQLLRFCGGGVYERI